MCVQTKLDLSISTERQKTQEVVPARIPPTTSLCAGALVSVAAPSLLLPSASPSADCKLWCSTAAWRDLGGCDQILGVGGGQFNVGQCWSEERRSGCNFWEVRLQNTENTSILAWLTGSPAQKLRLQIFRYLQWIWNRKIGSGIVQLLSGNGL